MARDFGYGGVANTNGPRSFAGKEAAVAVAAGGQVVYTSRYGVRGRRPGGSRSFVMLAGMLRLRGIAR